MQHFVITIKDLPQSVKAAQRCIASGQQFGINIEQFDATTPSNTDLQQAMQTLKIVDAGLKERWSRSDNATAAFISHFRLWQLAVEMRQEITIFEHDAVVVNKIPEFISYKGCINLGKPSYGKFNVPRTIGVNKLTSKRYFPGAHGYRVKPQAAKILVEQGRMFARPTDVFLNIDLFPFLEEYYPWPVEAHDSFSTIQNLHGCAAKHNFNDKYQLL